jgi:glutathione S-transferase
VLVDGDRVVVGSTACALFVEERHPDPPLVPADPAARGECLLLEDWADRAFMEVSRRIAFWNVLRTPGLLGRLFFPGASGAGTAVKAAVSRRLVARRFGLGERRYRRDVVEARELARLAVARLGSRRYLVVEALTLADLALAARSAPLARDPALSREPEVAALLAWGEPIIGPALAASYRSDLPRRVAVAAAG